MKDIISSPLLRFVALGLLAYLLYAWLIPDTREEIVVTPVIVDALLEREQEISLEPLTDERKEEIIQGYIDDEVLLREAFKRDYHLNDGRVRKRLLTVMRSSLTNMVADPTYAELQQYYEENIETYTTSEARSMDHVYFSYAEESMPEDPAAFLNTLENTDDFTTLGDFTLLGSTLRKITFRQLASELGGELATAVFAAQPGQWTGPLTSNEGQHYVRVTAEIPESVMEFEAVQQYLRSDYLFMKTKAAQDEALKELRENYIISIEE